MKRITHGARCAIKMHSTTGDVAALRHDLRNGVRHYFSDHRQCKSTFCKHTTDTSNVTCTIIIMINLCLGSSLLSKLPPSFLYDVKSAGDRFVMKARQLIQNKTTKLISQRILCL